MHTRRACTCTARLQIVSMQMCILLYYWANKVMMMMMMMKIFSVRPFCALLRPGRATDSLCPPPPTARRLVLARAPGLCVGVVLQSAHEHEGRRRRRRRRLLSSRRHLGRVTAARPVIAAGSYRRRTDVHLPGMHANTSSL